MSGWWWLAIILFVIGVILLIIGGVLWANNRNVHPMPWYVWFLVIGGIILIVIAAIMAIFLLAYPPVQTTETTYIEEAAETC